MAQLQGGVMGQQYRLRCKPQLSHPQRPYMVTYWIYHAFVVKSLMIGLVLSRAQQQETQP